MKRALMLCLLGALLVGCQDQRTPTAPPNAAAPPGGLLAAISDGAHGSGNADFFFLPPLQPSPRGYRKFDRGKFNPNLRPVVKICDGRDLANGECVKALQKGGQDVVFNAVRGWDGLPDWVDPEQYHVLWQTRNYNLVLNQPYRILVKVGSTLLGFLDIVPANGLLRALRITAGGQDIGWLDDWVVPIRFRIEQGALCAAGTNPVECTASTVVGAAPGTPGYKTVDVVLPSGHAAVSIPPDAVAPGQTVTIVIEKEPPQYGGKCLPTDIVQSLGCYHFGSEPPLYHFATPVRMEACIDVEPVPAEQRNEVVLFKNNATEGLRELPWEDYQLIDCSNFSASANLTGAQSSNFAAAALRRLGQWAGRLFGPQPLYASWFAGVPKGGGGTGSTFSDVGGAVPGTATQEAVGLTVPSTATVGQTGLSAIASGGSGTGAYSYASLAQLVCTVGATSGSITLLTPGTCRLTASKAADEIYKSATSAPREFAVAAGGAAITNVVLNTTTLTIDGAGVPYVAYLVNNTGSTLSGVFLQGWIDQNGASRAAGGAVLTCTATLGDLPPGSCNDNWSVNASNAGAGSGYLVPGSATARIELMQGSTVLSTFTIPVTLAAVAGVHYQGTLSIPQTWVADLDEGTLLPNLPPPADIWFEAVTANERYLTLVNGVKGAIFGTTAPGKSGCLGLTLSTVRIDMQALPAGMFVCFLTGSGRISEVKIVEAPGPYVVDQPLPTLVIGIRTFD